MTELLPTKTERRQIWKVLKRHRGTIARIARELGVTPETVWNALNGSFSNSEVLRLARTVAGNLLAQERQMPPQPKIDLREIRKVLKRHPGSITRIARELGITVQSVSSVLRLRRRHTSARVDRAAHALSQELLAQEAEQKRQEGAEP